MFLKLVSDINECDGWSASHQCPPGTFCLNTRGNYKCVCNNRNDCRAGTWQHGYFTLRAYLHCWTQIQIPNPMAGYIVVYRTYMYAHCTASDSDPYLDSNPQSLLFPSLRWISIPGLESECVSGNVIKPLGLIYTDQHRDRNRFLIPMNRHRIAISMVWMVVTLMISALSI